MPIKFCLSSIHVYIMVYMCVVLVVGSLMHSNCGLLGTAYFCLLSDYGPRWCDQGARPLWCSREVERAQVGAQPSVPQARLPGRVV